MSEAYEQFAKDTYVKVYHDMKDALGASGDLPILVVSGEMHNDPMLGDHIDIIVSEETDDFLKEYEDIYDLDISVLIPDSMENPALASAYTHMSNIQAASDLVGKDNVVVSVELNNKTLEQVISFIEKGSTFTTPIPALETISFALKNGYEIVASDPLNGKGDKGDKYQQERYDEEILAIGRHALRIEDTPKIVVHIGGTNHIGTLQGYDRFDLAENGEELLRDPEIDPFNGSYGKVLFYNTAQTTTYSILEGLFDDTIDYAQNPKNATQIDPPGAMDESDRRNIADRIEEASAEMHNTSEAASTMVNDYEASSFKR